MIGGVTVDCANFAPAKRTAIDGRSWWVVMDKKTRKYSTLLCFGKYRTRKECTAAILSAALLGLV